MKIKKRKENLKKILTRPILFLIVIVLLIGVWNFSTKHLKNNFAVEKTIQIGSSEIAVQLAQTPQETYQGLSDIEKIPAKTGMLFFYNQLSECNHVMRKMKFDLDFVFLRDGKVVHLEKNISKDFKGIISSPEKCNQVLEINAGEINLLEIKIGDKMNFTK